MATWETVCEILADLPAVEIAPPGGERVARVKGARLAFVAGRLIAPKRVVRDFLEM